MCSPLAEGGLPAWRFGLGLSVSRLSVTWVLMFRAFALLLLSTTSAMAWEVVPGDICEIRHTQDSAAVSVTYDLQSLDYAIAITLDEPWIASSVFALRFDGPASNMISTNRHILSNDDATLTVTDRGFGNVLNGLAFNETATALLGEQSVVLSLDGAAPAVQAFQACTRSLRV